MKMNRRKALIGIGSLAVGSGAALGSGAFTSVTADRTVNVSVAGDGSAFLGLSPTSNSGSFATTSNGTVELNLDGSSNSNSDGLNFNAVTTIDPLLTATNNGTSSVDFYVSPQSGSSASVATVNGVDVLSVPVTDSSSNNVGPLYLKFLDSGDNSIVSSDGTNFVSIAGSAGSEDLTLEIDTTDVDPTSSPTDYSIGLSGITFNADDNSA